MKLWKRVLALWYWSFSSRSVIRFWSHEKALDGSFGREIVDCIWGLIYKGREDCLHFIWHAIYKCPSSRWNWKHKSGQQQTKHLPSGSRKLRKTLKSQCQKGQGWLTKAALSCFAQCFQHKILALFVSCGLSSCPASSQDTCFTKAAAKIRLVSRGRKGCPVSKCVWRSHSSMKHVVCASQWPIWCLLSLLYHL